MIVIEPDPRPSPERLAWLTLDACVTASGTPTSARVCGGIVCTSHSSHGVAASGTWLQPGRAVSVRAYVVAWDGRWKGAVKWSHADGGVEFGLLLSAEASSPTAVLVLLRDALAVAHPESVPPDRRVSA